MMDIDLLQKMARKAKGKIGIGVKLRAEVIQKNISEAKRLGLPEVEIYENPVELCEDLKERRICAAVRGTLSSSELLAAIKET